MDTDTERKRTRRLQAIKDRADDADDVELPEFTASEMTFVYNSFQEKWDDLLEQLQDLHSHASGRYWLPKTPENSNSGA